ncbi:MAG: two component transcriptional regulator, winged helix family, partial [Thermoleophilia bacterium]|nr:two component transcriptional regulator, winged helix family [Thermoleophilia bacterium]
MGATDTTTAARILVVEDEPKLAQIIATALTRQGFSVDVVDRGDDALVRLSMPDAAWALVVLDRMLPGLDGTAVCERLRAAGNEVPILMLTAMGAVDDRVAGLDSGANDYLPKPFALKELYARVRALLRTVARPAAAADVGGVAGEVLEVGDLELDVEGLVAHRAGTRVDLRPKEAAILASLMRRPD